MIGSFLIFLREAIEGSLIISIMLTFLAAAGRRDLFRWVFAGVGAALLAAAAVGTLLYVLVRGSFVGSTAQTWFETITFLVAVILLSYMTFWMKSHSRSLSKDLKGEMGTALGERSGLALAGVAFLTVGREAIETAIFTLAIAFDTSAWLLLVGALSGLSLGLAISAAMYRMGLRLNLKRFFTIMGVALLVVAAGLLANAVANLQELGVLPGGNQVLWHTGAWLSDSAGAGDVLHGIVGYAAAPTALQVGAWATFLIGCLGLFLGGLDRVMKGGPRKVGASSRA